jgi:hypothetical protein
MVAVGSAVDLWVAAEDRTNVPNLIGRRIEEADGILGSRRLQSGMVTRQFSSKPKETIIGQNPQPGARVHPETSVNLRVSKGKRTSIIPFVGVILAVVGLILVVTIVNKIVTRKPKPPVETSEKDLDVTVDISIKPVTDPGKQVIEIEGSSIFEEGQNHE